MTSGPGLVIATVALGAGTFALRVAGSVLRARTELSAGVQRLMAVTVAVVFSAVIATSALMSGQEFAGPARPG